MSDPEIRSEVTRIEESVMARSETARKNRVAYFYLQTPEEIHRLSVLSAMNTAITCLLYRDFPGWLNARTEFSQPYSNGFAKDPMYLGTEEQRNAHALTDDELSAIWKAQGERLRQATIVRNVVPPGEDGGPLHGIQW